jgi:hypothetical protein
MNTEPPVTHRALLGTLSYFFRPATYRQYEVRLVRCYFYDRPFRAGRAYFTSSFFIILIYARASSTAAFPLIPVRQHTNRDPATRKALFLTLIEA